MSDAPRVAHSLAEANLYILATPCRTCGRGPLRHGEPEPSGDASALGAVSIFARCGTCKAATRWEFQLPGAPAGSAAEPAPVNPTAEPSRILDVAQWITLFRMTTEAAGQELDKTKARRLLLDAGQCLDEALKFFDDEDNDLPCVEAFFHQESRERFREHPEHFSRRRLLDLRSKLPTPWPMRPEGAS